MWHPPTTQPLTEEEILRKKERDAIEVAKVSKLVSAVDDWFSSSSEGKVANESIKTDYEKNRIQ